MLDARNFGVMPSNGLVGYWPLDEGTGSVSADLSGFNRHGVLLNMAPEDWVTGVSGTAVHFSQNNAFRFGCAGTNCPASTYAVSLWFNADVLSGTLFSYYAGEAFSNPSQKTIAFSSTFLHCGPSTLRKGAAQSIFVTNRWYHLVVNYQDTTSITVFVDGIDVSVDTDDYWNSGAFSLGRRLDGSSPLQFSGSIDEVALYDHVLSASEIAALGSARQ
ncbi:MAG: LamG domain-containing protein [Kofleriaceae bacterium]|nr:LamG domain-containing protein [Kofleriaceae bacterium]